jgi:hypothetical protein
VAEVEADTWDNEVGRAALDRIWEGMAFLCRRKVHLHGDLNRWL